MSAQMLSKDIHSIYQSLQQRLDQVTDFSDLFIFARNLFTLEQLRQLMKHSLTERYQKQQSRDSHSSLRPLFISLHQLKGIPSDYVHAHIFSFLPSKDYAKLPLVSKHFSRIMQQHSSIFNEKRYTLRLFPMCAPQPCSYDTKLAIGVHHRNGDPCVNIQVKRALLIENSDDIENTSIPWFKLKHWKLSLQGHDNSQCKATLFHQQNQAMWQCIEKYHCNIHALTIEAWSLKELVEFMFNNKRTYAKCICLHVVSLAHCLDAADLDAQVQESLDNILSQRLRTYLPNVIPNLQCFTMTVSDKSGFRMAQQVIHSLGNTLQCIKLFLDFDDRDDDIQLSDATIKIPGNVQWLCVDTSYDTGDSTGFVIDITQCTNLIGVQVGVDFRNVLWPTSEQQAIPFFLCDRRSGSHSIVHSQKLNAKFVYFVSHASNDSKPKDQPVTIQDFMNNRGNDNTKCIELSECENSSRRIFYDLLTYCFENEELRQNRLETYRKWWELGWARWIQYIHVDQLGN